MKDTERNSRHLSGKLDIHGILALAGIVGPFSDDVHGMDSNDRFSDYRLDGRNLYGRIIYQYSQKTRLWDQYRSPCLVWFWTVINRRLPNGSRGRMHTVQGRIHIVAAYSVLGIFPIALLLLLPSLRNDPRWQGMFL